MSTTIAAPVDRLLYKPEEAAEALAVGRSTVYELMAEGALKQNQKSRNAVPVPPVFVPLLRDHKALQEEMRAAAGEPWQEHRVALSRPDGRPLDPRADYEEFKELLAETGIDDRRLYDGSHHTAGAILHELGVDMPTIMEILRHTQISQTRRYVKGRSHLSKDAMRRMGEFFVPAPRARSGPH